MVGFFLEFSFAFEEGAYPDYGVFLFFVESASVVSPVSSDPEFDVEFFVGEACEVVLGVSFDVAFEYDSGAVW